MSRKVSSFHAERGEAKLATGVANLKKMSKRAVVVRKARYQLGAEQMTAAGNFPEVNDAGLHS